MSGGCRPTARGGGSARRSAGTAAGAAVDPGRASLEAVARGLLHPRAPARTIASTSASETSPAGRHGSSSASKQPRTSTGCRCPRSCVVSRASPIGRVGSSARRRAQEARARRARRRGCRGPAPASRWSKRARDAVTARAPGRRTGRPRGWRRSPRARRARRAARALAVRVRAPRRYVAHAPVIRRCEWMTRSPSKRRNRCLPCASIRLDRALPPRRCGQRSGPQVLCGVSSSSGTRPARTGRMRFAA